MTPPIPSAPDELTAEWFSQALAARAPGVEVAAVRVLDRHAGTTGRVIHGDSHLGNLFEDAEIGFLDWAVVSRGPGIRDVAYYLSNSMPTELRRAQERDLLARYRDGLLAAGVDAPDPAALWRRYRLDVAYSWVAAATTSAMGDKWQPQAVGRAAMARATDAVADLGTVELFRDALGL